MRKYKLHKLQMCSAASSIAVAVTLLTASLLYARQPRPNPALIKCNSTYKKCMQSCDAALKPFEAACESACESKFEQCAAVAIGVAKPAPPVKVPTSPPPNAGTALKARTTPSLKTPPSAVVKPTPAAKATAKQKDKE
jgi:hypothetical protein